MINNLKIILNKFSKYILNIKWYYYLIIYLIMILDFITIYFFKFNIEIAYILLLLIYFVLFDSIFLAFKKQNTMNEWFCNIISGVNVILFILLFIGFLQSIFEIYQYPDLSQKNIFYYLEILFKIIFISCIFFVNPFLASYNFTKHTSKNKSIAKDIFKNYLVFLFIFLSFWYIIPKINKAVSELENK